MGHAGLPSRVRHGLGRQRDPPHSSTGCSARVFWKAAAPTGLAFWKWTSNPGSAICFVTLDMLLSLSLCHFTFEVGVITISPSPGRGPASRCVACGLEDPSPSRFYSK